MFKVMVRVEGAKAFKTIAEAKTFEHAAFILSRHTDMARKIVKGRKIIAKRGY